MMFAAKKSYVKIGLFSSLLLLVAGTTHCGPKNSVDDNETPDGPLRTDSRSRLTGGNSPIPAGTVVSYCRLPLDVGTVVDPRRPGLMQNVLTTSIDTRCAGYQELRVTLKSKQKLTLVGKFVCRSGVQFNEQICTGTVQDLLSKQKNSISIPVVADESWRSSDVEASVEFF
ncbi:hypothetical protein EBR21_04080 [bacterium]|nr:hypothetical protein [bacterium]